MDTLLDLLETADELLVCGPVVWNARSPLWKGLSLEGNPQDEKRATQNNTKSQFKRWVLVDGRETKTLHNDPDLTREVGGRNDCDSTRKPCAVAGHANLPHLRSNALSILGDGWLLVCWNQCVIDVQNLIQSIVKKVVRKYKLNIMYHNVITLQICSESSPYSFSAISPVLAGSTRSTPFVFMFVSIPIVTPAVLVRVGWLNISIFTLRSCSFCSMLDNKSTSWLEMTFTWNWLGHSPLPPPGSSPLYYQASLVHSSCW